MQEAMNAVNYWAVVAAALSMFVLGGIWYSLLFGKSWMRANGFTQEQLRASNPGIIFGGAFLLALAIAYVLALFLGPERDAFMGATAGFMTGLFWVAAAQAITYLFERKPLSLFLINLGYHIVAFTVMGWILGGWR